MIGRMSGPLAGAIGEGNCDGIAMLMNGDDVVGEYSASSSARIRRAPMPATRDLWRRHRRSEVHNDGEIYAAIVWRLRHI